MFRFALIDDNLEDLSNTRAVIQNLCDADCDIYQTASDFLEADKVYDAMFLDIDMPRVNGIDFARVIQERWPDLLIIFNSWYDHLIFEGMKLLPFTFVRKAYLKDDMRDCILNLEKRLIDDKKSLKIKIGTTEETIVVSNILYFEQTENYCNLYLKGKKQLDIKISLQKLSTLLKPYPSFIQISRNTIINMENVISYRNKLIKMEHDITLEVARRRWQECTQALLKYKASETNW